MENDEEIIARPQYRKSGTNAALFVSLYVVLLAFFILLVSMSQQDVKKMEEVSESVNKAFKLPKKLITPQVMPSIGADMNVQTFFSSMKDIVARSIPLEELKIVQSGNKLTLLIPTRLLYKPGDSELRPEHEVFLERLSTIFDEWSGALRIDLSFLVGFATPLTATSDTAALPVTRAGSFARDMVNRGVADKSITIGVSQQNPNDIELSFSVRSVAASKITIEAPEQATGEPQSPEQAPTESPAPSSAPDEEPVREAPSIPQSPPASPEAMSSPTPMEVQPNE